MEQIHYDIVLDLIPLLIAVAIGFATGWWIWANRVRIALSDPVAPPAPTLARVAPAQATPVVVPVPVAVPEAVISAAGPIPAPQAGQSDPADSLSQIKGIGPKLAALLGSLGVTRFSQIAAWTPADVARIDAQLGNFAGRITRDNWIEQADLLVRGEIAAFESKYGKLDSGTP